MAIAERSRSRIRLVVTAVILALLAIFPWTFLALWKMQTDPLFEDQSSGPWVNLVASLAVQGVVHLCFFVGCALLACTNRYLTTFTILILHWGLHAVFVCAIYGSAVLGLGQYRSGQFVKVQNRMLDGATAEAREEYTIASEPIVRFSHFPLITVVYLITSLASVLINTVPALRLPPVESTYSHLGSVLLWSVAAVLHAIHYADIWSEAPHPIWISIWVGYALVATAGVRMNSAHDTIRWTQLHLAQLRDQRSGRSNGLRIVLVEPTDSCNSFISCLIGVKPTCCPWRANVGSAGKGYQAGRAQGSRQGRGKPSILPVFVSPTITIPYSDRPPPTASGSHPQGGSGGSSGQHTSISSASSAGARMLASGTAPTVPHGQQAAQQHKKVASVPSGAAAAAADRYAAPRANVTTAGIRKNRMASSSVSDSDHIAMDASDADPEEGLLGTKRVDSVEPQREQMYPSTASRLTTGLRRNEGGIVNSLWGQSRSRDSIELAMVPYYGYEAAWYADSQRPHRMWMDKQEGMFRLALSSGGQGGHLYGLPLVGLLRPRPNTMSPASMSRYNITRETVVFQDPRDISRFHPVFGYLEAALVHCESHARRRTVGTSQEHPGLDFGQRSLYYGSSWRNTLSDEESILARPSGSGSEAAGPVHLAHTANLPEHHPPFVWVPAVDESTSSYVCFRSVGLGLIASIGRIFGTAEALDEQGDGPWLVDRQISVLRQTKVSLGGRYGRNSAAEKDLMAGLGGRSPRGLGSIANASDAHRIAMRPQLSRESSFGVRTSRNRSAVGDSEFEAEMSSADEQEQKRSKPAILRSTDTLVKRLRCSHLARYSQAVFSSLSPLQVRVGLMIVRQVQLDTATLMRNLGHPAFGSVVGSDGGPRSSRIPSVIELGWSQQLSRMNHHAVQDTAGETSMNEVEDYGRYSPGAAFEFGSAERLYILHYIAAGLAHLHSFEPPVIHGSISTDAILQQDNGSIRISNLHVAALRLRMQGALQRLGLQLAHGSAGHQDPVGDIRSFNPSEPWKAQGLQINHIECSENSAWFLPKGESGLNERIAQTLFGKQLGRPPAEGTSSRPYGKPWPSAKAASDARNRKDANRAKGGGKSTHMMLVQSGAAVAGDTAGSRAASRARVPMPKTPLRSMLSGVGARSGTTTAVIANEAMKVQDYDNSTDGDGSHTSVFSMLWSTEVGKEEGHHLPVHVFDVPIPVGISSSNEVVEKVLMKQSVQRAASSSPALCCGDIGSTQVRDARIFASCYLAAVSLATTRRCCLAPEVCNFAQHCRALRVGAPGAGALNLESNYPTASQDIYGFGTIMVEIAFGCSMETVRKYAGGGTTVIAQAVMAYWKQFKRATVSAAYIRLANECLATIPAARPKAADLIGRLHDMSVDLDSDATPSTPAAGTSGHTGMFSSSRLHHQRSRSRPHTEGFEMSRADNSTMGASDANIAMPDIAVANAASASPPKMRRSKTSDVPKSKEGLQAPEYATEASNIRKSVTTASGSKGSHRAGSPRRRKDDSARSSKKSNILPTAEQADAPSGRASLRRRYSGSALLTKSYKRTPNSARRLPGPPSSVISSYKSQSRPHDLDRVRQQVLDNLQAMQSAVDPRQFHLLNGIGEGTYAIVYRGYLGHLPVAIKSFKPPPQGTANSASMLMLLRRIKIALTEHEIVWRLSHPNIVRSFGWAVEGNDVSLLWQLCEVGTLKNVLVKHFEWERGQASALSSGGSGAASEAKSLSMVPLDLSSKSRSDTASLDPLPKVETLGGMHRSMGKGSSIPWLTLRTRIKLLHDIAIAIEHIHRANIVHRDIKPNNIFLTRQDSGSVRAVLGDFGEATYVAPNAKVSGLKGTIGFCAPEVFRGREYDRSVDIYSFGATITAMMSCHAPFMYDERVVKAYFAILRKKEEQKSSVRMKPDSTRARGHMYRDKMGMYLVQSVSWSDVDAIDLSQVKYDWSSIIKMVISPTPLQYWIEWNVRKGRLKPLFKCFSPLLHPDDGDMSSIYGVHVWPGLLYGSGHNTEPVSGAVGGPAATSYDGRMNVVVALGRLAGNCLSRVPSRRPSAVSVAGELRRLLRLFIPSRSYLRQIHQRGKSMLAEAASTSSQGSESRGIHAASAQSGAAGSDSQPASGGALVKWSGEAKSGSSNEGKQARVPGMLSSYHSGGSLVPRVMRSHGSEEVNAAVSRLFAAGGLFDSKLSDSIGISRVRMLVGGSLRHATSCPSELVAFSMLVSRMVLASLGPNTATGHDAIRMAGKDLVEAAMPNADVAVQQFTVTKRMRARWVPMGVNASTVTNVSSGSPGKLFDVSTAGLAEEAWQRTLRNLPGAMDGSSKAGIADAYSRKKRRKQLEALSTDAAAGMAGTVLPRDFSGLHPSVAAFVSLEGAIPSVVERNFGPSKGSMKGWNPASLGAEARLKCVSWGMVLDFFIRFCYVMPFEKEDYWMATCLLLQLIQTRMYRYLSPTRWHRTTMTALLIAQRIMKPGRPVYLDMLWPPLLGLSLPLEEVDGSYDSYAQLALPELRKRIYPLVNSTSMPTVAQEKATGALQPQGSGSSRPGSGSIDGRVLQTRRTLPNQSVSRSTGSSSPRPSSGAGSGSGPASGAGKGDTTRDETTLIPDDDTIFALYAPATIEKTAYGVMTRYFANMLTWKIKADLQQLRYLPGILQVTLDEDGQVLPDELRAKLQLASFEEMDPGMRKSFDTNLAAHRDVFLRHRASEKKKQREKLGNASIGASHAGSMLFSSIGYSIVESEDGESDEESGAYITRSSVGSDGFNVSGTGKDVEFLYHENSGSITGKGPLHDSASDSDGVFRSASGSKGAASPTGGRDHGAGRVAERVPNNGRWTQSGSYYGGGDLQFRGRSQQRPYQRHASDSDSSGAREVWESGGVGGAALLPTGVDGNSSEMASKQLSRNQSASSDRTPPVSAQVSPRSQWSDSQASEDSRARIIVTGTARAGKSTIGAYVANEVARYPRSSMEPVWPADVMASGGSRDSPTRRRMMMAPTGRRMDITKTGRTGSLEPEEESFQARDDESEADSASVDDERQRTDSGLAGMKDITG